MSKANRIKPRDLKFQPMQRGVRTIDPEKEARMVAKLNEMGVTDPAEIEKLMDKDKETWINNLYVVGVTRDLSGDVHTLSIRRQDRGACHDWRHFQRIKNEIAGPEVEAIELYPAESRLVDSANQFWLWCLPPGVSMPLGFQDRYVDDVGASQVGAGQRPFD